MAKTTTDAYLESGFSGASRFYEDAEKRLGMKPARFRQGGAGETIRFALGECSLGHFLVAATDRGVCSVALGDDPDGLLEVFQSRFNRAELIGADAAFEELVAKVVALVDTPGASIELPLDVRGTAFQHMVWDALRAIPPGETRSYVQVAETIGRPKAFRAVAQACANNPVALLVPCHRVVHSDGTISGYRWGVERKRALLDRER